MKKLICILAIVISFTSCSIYPSGYETIDRTGDMYRHWDPIYYGYWDPFFLRPRNYFFYAPRPIVIEKHRSYNSHPRNYVAPRNNTAPLNPGPKRNTITPAPFSAPRSTAPIRSFPRR